MDVNITKTIMLSDMLSDEDYYVELKVDNLADENDYPYTLKFNGENSMILRESDLTKLTRMFAKAKKLYKEADSE